MPFPRSRKIALSVLAAAVFSLAPQSNSLAAGPYSSATRFSPARSLVVPIAIFGEDERKILKGQGSLRSRFGVLHHFSTGGYCTAFCVAPDVVATAGHCVLGTRQGQRPDPAQFRFRRDDRRSSPPARVAGWRTGSAAMNVLTGADRLNTHPPINASADWALVRLDRNACPATGLRISSAARIDIAERAGRGELFHVSYHRDIRGWKLAISNNCGVVAQAPGSSPKQISQDFNDTDHLLLHTCDTEAASSGSPLLVSGPDGPEVVGINVGTYVRSRVITHDGEIIQRVSSETIANTALVTSPIRTYVDDFIASRPLERRSEIEEVQAGLAEAGFFAGELDGRFGPVTRAAVAAYQASTGTAVTGIPTRTLLEQLRSRRP